MFHYYYYYDIFFYISGDDVEAPGDIINVLFRPKIRHGKGR